MNANEMKAAIKEISGVIETKIHFLLEPVENADLTH